MSFSKNDQRKVLLIDRDSTKQQLRAVALRNCEVDVHTVSNISDAGRLCKKHSYHLVLLAAQENSEEAAALFSELKKSKPRQRVALLVGAPQFIREIGRKAANAQRADASLAPSLVPGASHHQPTLWQAMIQRLLAAG